MFILRFVVFDLQESSKYLIARGRDEEAVQVWSSLHPSKSVARLSLTLGTLQVLEHIARRNGRTISLTVDQLSAIRASCAPPTAMQLLRQLFSSTTV